MVQRVALDCLNRTDLNPEIKRGVQATIRHYENQRFWFNETQTALVCVRSVETIAVPADFLFIQELQVTQNSSSYELVPVDFQLLRKMNLNTSVGLPTRYAKYGTKFYLANVPDSAYPAPCYYVHKLAPLVLDADTNDWLSAAEDVIVYGAAKFVAAGMLDTDNATKFAGFESMFAREQLYQLRDQNYATKLRGTKF